MKILLSGFLWILFLMHKCHGQTAIIPIGNPCSVDEECGPNSECITSYCQCKSGHTVTPTLECKVSYDGTCIEDNDCNVHMGLGCVKSACKCSNLLDKSYVYEIGGCINSTMKLMYHDILDVLNQTEFELSKFSTLFHLFMVHRGAVDGGDNLQDTSASVLAQETIFELQGLEDQIKSSQSNVPVVVAPDTHTNVHLEPKAQLESPIIPIPIPSTSPTPGISIQSLSPITPSPLPNSFNNLVLPILTPQQQQPTLPNIQNLGNLNPTGSANIGNLPQLDQLTNVLPSLLNMFREFLPFLQSFNNVLGSSVLSQNPQMSQVNPSLFRQGGSGPGGILQIPGRIFNTFFGRNSTINQIKRRIIPFDFGNKAIPFLPWPLG